MSLRLPGPHDPLTLAEQADLDRQLALMLHRAEPNYNLLRCELENVSRMHATLEYYKGLLQQYRSPVELDAGLPRRVRLNGIDYLQSGNTCTSFGADPDLKSGPITQEDRGWDPQRDGGIQ